jgi:hypothetical protein
MTHNSTDSESALPEPLEQFEQELRQAADSAAVLERYQTQYPELSEILGKLAEAMAMLQATPLRQPGRRDASRARRRCQPGAVRAVQGRRPRRQWDRDHGNSVSRIHDILNRS